MKFQYKAFILIALCLLNLGASQKTQRTNLYDGCPEDFSNLSRSALVRHILGNEPALSSTPTITGVRDPRVAKWLDFYRKQLMQMDASSVGLSFKNVGETIRVLGEDVEILSPLGIGYEGTVYLVNTKQGVSVAKIYHTNQPTLSFREQLLLGKDTARSAGKSLPQVIKVDEARRTVLLEYREGIPAAQLVAFHDVVGVNQKEASAIANSCLREFPKFDLKDLVYSFSRRKCYLIDAF